jgi:ABC-2 type transport system ATP-binding protein
VALIAAFSTRAPILIMDEPTSGLDPLMERVFRSCLAEAKERGQTIFLSSHQLGEVEAVCDRVGILRAGRLVEVAGLAELRRLRRLEVAVGFAGHAPEPSVASSWPGVDTARRVGDDRLALQLNGSLGAALRKLGEMNPVSLDVREPTLEEIFLEYYGDQE